MTVPVYVFTQVQKQKYSYEQISDTSLSTCMWPDCLIIHITLLPNDDHNNKIVIVEFPFKRNVNQFNLMTHIIFYIREILAVMVFIASALSKEEGIYIFKSLFELFKFNKCTHCSECAVQRVKTSKLSLETQSLRLIAFCLSCSLLIFILFKL